MKNENKNNEIKVNKLIFEIWTYKMDWQKQIGTHD